MRVTRVMQDYIRDEVKKRIEPKYEDAKKTSEERARILEEFWIDSRESLNAAANGFITRFLKEHPEFLDNRAHHERIVSLSSWGIKHADDTNTWRKRMEDEIDAKYKEIVISLELGGTKSDLDELLSNI